MVALAARARSTCELLFRMLNGTTTTGAGGFPIQNGGNILSKIYSIVKCILIYFGIFLTILVRIYILAEYTIFEIILSILYIYSAYEKVFDIFLVYFEYIHSNIDIRVYS